MGWTSCQLPYGEKVDEFLRMECEHDEQRILASSYVNYSVWYAALKLTTNEVVAVICLVRMTKSREISYKSMDETVGPYEYGCPRKILELLTPTNSEYAINWRKQCWENIEKRKKLKFKVGQKLIFKEPVRFTTGKEHTELLIQSVKPLRFCSGYDVYRIRRNYLLTAEFTVVQPPSS